MSDPPKQDRPGAVDCSVLNRLLAEIHAAEKRAADMRDVWKDKRDKHLQTYHESRRLAFHDAREMINAAFGDTLNVPDQATASTKP